MPKRRPANDSDRALGLLLRNGREGPLTTDAVRDIVKAKGEAAGIEGRMYPHRLRHTAAHRWLALGGQESDALKIFGWRNAKMLHSRYGASAAAERAIEAHRRISPGDRL